MKVWEALGMDSWKWLPVGNQPTGVLVWVQDEFGRMDLGIWRGRDWDCAEGCLRGEPTHWRNIPIVSK